MIAGSWTAKLKALSIAAVYLFKFNTVISPIWMNSTQSDKSFWIVLEISLSLSLLVGRSFIEAEDCETDLGLTLADTSDDDLKWTVRSSTATSSGASVFISVVAVAAVDGILSFIGCIIVWLRLLLLLS